MESELSLSIHSSFFLHFLLGSLGTHPHEAGTDCELGKDLTYFPCSSLFRSL